MTVISTFSPVADSADVSTPQVQRNTRNAPLAEARDRGGRHRLHWWDFRYFELGQVLDMRSVMMMVVVHCSFGNAWLLTDEYREKWNKMQSARSPASKKAIIIAAMCINVLLNFAEKYNFRSCRWPDHQSITSDVITVADRNESNNNRSFKYKVI